MFTAALFIIAKNWKQSRCPSIGEFINQLWYMYAVECYSTIKRNDVLSHAITWMNLENSKLGERSQSQRITYYIYRKCPE